MADIHTQSLLSEVAELWRTGEGSDITIKCEGREFKVHRLIAACQNGMLESQTGVIEHKTFDADTVERLLEYVYTRDYQLPEPTAVSVRAIGTSEPNGGTDEVTITDANAKCILHTRMYAIGDYYQLPTLKDRALFRVQSAVQVEFEADGFAYVVKEVHELIGKHEKDFHHAIRKLCLSQLDTLTKDKTFMTAIAQVAEMQELTASLLNEVFEKLNGEASYANTLLEDLNCAESDLIDAQQKHERERQAHGNALAALWSRVDHYQAVIKGLMDDVGRLPLRCPNIRCSSTNKAPWKLQRQAHADYGEGTGFVEIQCGRCGHKLSK
ncbi:hypothetical protein D0865_07286 [Hortaea werneckii]|uniref:BTB domain-containing protein n=1 Tax=Hortaea werneckii TaxID=91943 RepID=A0A3M7CC89_HORWE|nr:hypothetical protein D0865_07286 [Hortaea werneckii]